MNEKTVFNVTTPDESSGFLLWQVTTLWQREIRKALDPIDLTHTQFVLLASIMWLSQFETPITQIKLSNHSKIDVMTTSSVLRTLIQKGLIERNESTDDTRSKNVLITELGRVKAKLAIKAVEAVDNSFFGVLGRDIGNFNQDLLQLLQQK